MSVYVGFVVDKAALGYVSFLSNLVSPTVIIPPTFHTNLHPQTTLERTND